MKLLLWRHRVALLTLVVWVGHAGPVLAQKYQFLGPGKCINCHDHENEKTWSEKKDGPPPMNHLNALKQMETQKSAVFAKAIGLADPYDVKGACVRCHATVFRGDANGGVTCESCHGAASGYIDVHQQKGAYQQAVAAGMNDTVKKPAAWAPMCMKCHLMDDQRLIDAGHPSGDNFDLGAKFATVALHWKSSYPNKADIAALGRTEATKIAAVRKASGRGPGALPAPAPPSGQPSTGQLPAPTPGRTVQPAPTPPSAGVQPLPATAGQTSSPAAPGRAQTVPGQMVPNGPSPSNMPASRSGASPGTPASVPPSIPAPQRLPPRGAQPPAGGPISPAAGSTLPVGLPPAPPPAVAPVADSNGNAMSVPLSTTLPQSPVAMVAAVQGRVIVILDGLLRRGARAPVPITPPPPKADYRGPDAELLRLQQEVLALAVESLGIAPKTDQTKPPPK